MAKSEVEERGLMDVLLDKDDRDPIVLADEDGSKIVFEQVAVVPLGSFSDRNLFVILKPLEGMDGVADDEAVVFRVDEENGEACLKFEADGKTAEAVFDAYYDLVDEVLTRAEEEKRNKK